MPLLEEAPPEGATFARELLADLPILDAGRGGDVQAQDEHTEERPGPEHEHHRPRFHDGPLVGQPRMG
jgi:hypothetical protein